MGKRQQVLAWYSRKSFFSDQTDTLEFIAGPSTDLSSKSKQIKPNETGKPESDNKKPLNR